MRPTDAHRTALRQVTFFSALADQECDDLLRCLKERRLATGEVLFCQGDVGDTLVIAIDGGMVVRARRPDGVEVDIRQVRAGEVIGEMTCIDPAPRSASVVATEETVVYELSRDALDALRRAAPSTAGVVVGAVIKEVTRRLREIDERIARQLGTHVSAPPPAMPETHRSNPPPPSTPPPDATASPPTVRSGFWKFVDRMRGGG